MVLLAKYLSFYAVNIVGNKENYNKRNVKKPKKRKIDYKKVNI